MTRREDSVLPVVRAVAAAIVGVLVLAVIVLYFLPGQTERFWSWTISPSMTAMQMGAGYAAGAYFFARVLFTRSWRSVTLGFLPITAFTSFMLLATLLHWDRFNHSHVAFFAWTFLYVVTPVLVPALWLANRPADPGHEPGEPLLPPAARGALAAAGLGILALALVMIVAPSAVVDRWPWQLTPLTSRVLGGFLALTGVTLAAIAWGARWRAAKTLIESLILGTLLILAAIPRAWDGLDPALWVRWTYAIAMAVGVVLLAGLWLWMEARSRAAVPPQRHETAQASREPQ